MVILVLALWKVLFLVPAGLFGWLLWFIRVGLLLVVHYFLVRSIKMAGDYVCCLCSWSDYFLIVTVLAIKGIVDGPCGTGWVRLRVLL